MSFSELQVRKIRRKSSLVAWSKKRPGTLQVLMAADMEYMKYERSDRIFSGRNPHSWKVVEDACVISVQFLIKSWIMQVAVCLLHSQIFPFQFLRCQCSRLLVLWLTSHTSKRPVTPVELCWLRISLLVLAVEVLLFPRRGRHFR